MYARILLVGSTPWKDADTLFRVRETLRKNGHAVAQCELHDDAERCRQVGSFAKTFQPTVILWDARTGDPSEEEAQTLAESGALTVLLWPNDSSAVARLDAVCPAFVLSESRLEAEVSLSPSVDDAYRRAITSRPETVRSGAFSMQALDDRRRALLAVVETDGSCEMTVEGFDPTWGSRLTACAPANAAFEARGRLACVLFDGPDAPSPLEAALRMGEGVAVLAERSLVQRWADQSMATIVEPFDSGEELASMLSHTAALADSACRQNAFLDEARSLDEAVEAFLDECAALAKQRGRRSVRAMERPGKQFMLYGWFGMQNFGDDLLLMTASRRIQKRFPEAYCTVVGGNAAEVRLSFGMEAYTPDQKHELYAALKTCCSISFYGGLDFDDPMELTAGELELFMNPWIEPTGQAAICLMAWWCGVPAVFLCSGAGPLEKPPAQRAMRTIGLTGARFVLRDQHSADLLRTAGVDAAQMDVQTDMILGARSLLDETAPANLPEGMTAGGYITVSLRDWPLNPEGFEHELASALDEIADKTEMRIAFVPFSPEDVAIGERVAAAMQKQESVVLLRQRPSEELLLAIMAGSKLAFAMRLHCSILHHVQGKPAVGLNYNDKIEAHFRSIGQEGLLLALDSKADEMAKAVHGTLEEYESVSGSVKTAVTPLEEKVDEAFRILYDSLGVECRQQPRVECYQPRSISLAQAQYEQSQREIDWLRNETAQWRNRAEEGELRIKEMEESHAWKIGNGLARTWRKATGRHKKH